jgi:hypothetical protein
MLALIITDWLYKLMEKPSHEQEPAYKDDLVSVFGEEGTVRLLSQIAHDDPTLSNEDVLQHAWSIIPEATAYMMPADTETLTNAAILVHEGYEAHRRVTELQFEPRPLGGPK